MRRQMMFLFISALVLALLSGCGQAPAQMQDPQPTEAEVLAAYDQAAEVYDWFDLCSLPIAGGEPLEEDGTPYDPNNDGFPYYPVEDNVLKTYADLETRVRACFSPALADSLLNNTINYRDINGRLYSIDGARGGNLYFLDKTAAAEQVDGNHWTVTITFWADFEDSVQTPIPGTTDTTLTPVATTGYSKTVLDYEQTPEGWRFTNFCPSDGLDLDADTVFTFDYEQAFSGTLSYQDYSDWQLACYLIHADGGYAEAPSDLLLHRFLERPEDILKVLALLDGAPYKNIYPHIDGIVAGPGYAAANWLYFDEQMEFLSVLDNCRPEAAGEQAVLDKIQTAYETAAEDQRVFASSQFSFYVGAGSGMLCLGQMEGAYPWGYTDFPETPQPAGRGDNGEIGYSFSCRGMSVDYFMLPDETDSAYIFRMTATQPGVPTDAGIEVGDTAEDVQAAYPDAVVMGAVGEWEMGADYALIYEPGGWAFCKHIAFFIKNGVVVEIEIEDLMDGRLLGD
ncbi:hypothetical protein SAMN05216343_12128 [Oscillibacter sp. PC13]|uniref:hypothetical protein n=1 Tax=Oscillibacter sp. PC13 TaxID=1855299 RepID=UPI0008E7F7C8|nr:hypothetical protein [Oscillibacter sp. PC13]SFQ02905.1 hypothetical protein SAMN05216343_12128 [Oscillibacter sp. PC13]